MMNFINTLLTVLLLFLPAVSYVIFITKYMFMTQAQRISDLSQCKDIPYTYDAICTKDVVIKEPHSCLKNVVETICTEKPVFAKGLCHKTDVRWISYECVRTVPNMQCKKQKLMLPTTCSHEIVEEEAFECTEDVVEEDCREQQVTTKYHCPKEESIASSYVCLGEEWETICKEVPTAVAEDQCRENNLKTVEYPCDTACDGDPYTEECLYTKPASNFRNNRLERQLGDKAVDGHDGHNNSNSNRHDDEGRYEGDIKNKPKSTDNGNGSRFTKNTKNRNSDNSRNNFSRSINSDNSSKMIGDTSIHNCLGRCTGVAKVGEHCFRKELAKGTHPCQKLVNDVKCYDGRISKRDECSKNIDIVKNKVCEKTENINVCTARKKAKKMTCYKDVRRAVSFPCLEEKEVSVCSNSTVIQTSALCHNRTLIKEPFECVEISIEKKCQKKSVKNKKALCHKDVISTFWYKCRKTGIRKHCPPSGYLLSSSRSIIATSHLLSATLPNKRNIKKIGSIENNLNKHTVAREALSRKSYKNANGDYEYKDPDSDNGIRDEFNESDDYYGIDINNNTNSKTANAKKQGRLNGAILRPGPGILRSPITSLEVNLHDTVNKRYKTNIQNSSDGSNSNASDSEDEKKNRNEVERSAQNIQRLREMPKINKHHRNIYNEQSNHKDTQNHNKTREKLLKHGTMIGSHETNRAAVEVTHSAFGDGNDKSNGDDDKNEGEDNDNDDNNDGNDIEDKDSKKNTQFSRHKPPSKPSSSLYSDLSSLSLSSKSLCRFSDVSKQQCSSVFASPYEDTHIIINSAISPDLLLSATNQKSITPANYVPENNKARNSRKTNIDGDEDSSVSATPPSVVVTPFHIGIDDYWLRYCGCNNIYEFNGKWVLDLSRSSSNSNILKKLNISTIGIKAAEKFKTVVHIKITGASKDTHEGNRISGNGNKIYKFRMKNELPFNNSKQMTILLNSQKGTTYYDHVSKSKWDLKGYYVKGKVLLIFDGGTKGNMFHDRIIFNKDPFQGEGQNVGKEDLPGGDIRVYKKHDKNYRQSDRTQYVNKKYMLLRWTFVEHSSGNRHSSYRWFRQVDYNSDYDNDGSSNNNTIPSNSYSS